MKPPNKPTPEQDATYAALVKSGAAASATDPPPTAAVVLPHAERKHAKRSPSSLGSFAVCPHYQSDDDRPIHPVTLEGTAVHEAIEKRDLGGLTPDLKQIAQVGIRYWDSLLATRPGYTQYVEPKINIPNMGYGHADLVLISPDGTEGDLVDWKAGYNLQAEIERNIQQRAYGAGLFRRFDRLQLLRMHVIYVRLGEGDLTHMNRQEVRQVELELIAIDRRAEDAEKGLIQAHNPDPSVCIYCKLAGICPALNKLAAPIADAYAKARPDTLVVPAAYDPATITNPAVMSKALAVADIMERWAESVRRHAVDLRVNTGQEIPGYALTHRNGAKSVVDADLAYSIAAKAGLAHAEIMQAVTLSVPKLLDAVKSRALRGKKQQAADAFEDALRDESAMVVGQESYYLRKSRGEAAQNEPR